MIDHCRGQRRHEGMDAPLNADVAKDVDAWVVPERRCEQEGEWVSARGAASRCASRWALGAKKCGGGMRTSKVAAPPPLPAERALAGHVSERRSSVWRGGRPRRDG